MQTPSRIVVEQDDDAFFYIHFLLESTPGIFRTWQLCGLD